MKKSLATASSNLARFYRLDAATATWVLATPSTVETWPALEQALVFDAWPEVDDKGAPQWRVGLTRIGGRWLTAFGIDERLSLRTDFELIFTAPKYDDFKAKVIAAGGVVKAHVINIGKLGDIVADAQALRQDLDGIRLAAEQLAQASQPDAATITELERLTEVARTTTTALERQRAVVMKSSAQLQKEPGRANDKAQAAAWLAGLADPQVAVEVRGWLVAATARRATALAGATTPQADPRLAQLAVLLTDLYGAGAVHHDVATGQVVVRAKGTFVNAVVLSSKGVEAR